MWTEINGTGLVLLNVPRPIVYGGWVHSYREHDLGMWGTLDRAPTKGSSVRENGTGNEVQVSN